MSEAPKEEKSVSPQTIPAPTTVPTVPEALEADDDADSALGVASIGDSTTSVSSSILKHRTENGRTYHAYKEGKYLLPNDETEKDRLDLQHHIHLMDRDGKLTSIEFEKPIHRVLDVGTGTGIWAIDYADEHPETEVLGVDLSPIQPSFLPPNVKFEIDDVEEPWTWHDKFDFIHMRTMTGCIADWAKLIKQAYEHTTPGGYIELWDPIAPAKCDDTSMKPDSALLKWSNLLVEATTKSGRAWGEAASYGTFLEKAGYTDIKLIVSYWPMNTWPKNKKMKEIGRWQCSNFTNGASGISMALFTRLLGWSAEEVEVFLIDVKREMKDTSIHVYWEMYTWSARKPL